MLWAVTFTGGAWVLTLLAGATGVVAAAWVAGAALVGSFFVLISLFPVRRWAA